MLFKSDFDDGKFKFKSRESMATGDKEISEIGREEILPVGNVAAVACVSESTDDDDEGARECTGVGTEWTAEENEELEPCEMKEEDDICERGLSVSSGLLGKNGLFISSKRTCREMYNFLVVGSMHLNAF